VVKFSVSSTSAESETSANLQNQMLEEVKILRRAAHPHIIKLHEHFQTEGELWLVMEYIVAGDLEAYIRKHGVFSEQQARHVLGQVMSAVDFCHNDLQVVHRDIKPANCLIAETSTDGMLKVKLSDFGLSTTYQSTRMMKDRCGSKLYTAPELLQNAAYTRAVDCWSVGIMAFYLLTLQFPFHSGYDSSAYAEPNFPKGEGEGPSMSNAAQDLIRHLLNTDPLHRFTIKEAHQHPWIQGATSEYETNKNVLQLLSEMALSSSPT